MDDRRQQITEEDIWRDQMERLGARKMEEYPRLNALGHPIWTIIWSLGAILLVVLNARMDGVTGRRLLLSIAFGLAFAIPIVAYAKCELRRQRDMWAESCIEYADMRTGHTPRNWLIWGVVYLVYCFTAGYFHLSAQVGLCAGLATAFLAYPEQKAIWIAAKARLSQMEGADSAKD